MAEPLVVVIVGAGPRGTGVLERLLANAGELLPGRPLRVELVDPFPPGGGRVWRLEQSSLMWMNALAGNITMFTDDTVACDGPIRPGPSLSEWAAADGTHWDVLGMSFASRQVQSRYLAWVFEHVVARRPDGVEVVVHPTAAVELTEAPDGRQLVRLADREAPLVADLVVLTMGHQEAEPTAEDLRMADFAARHGLRHLPSAYTADADLSGFQPGEHVVLRGFGAAFVDVMALLTEGRGGTYRRESGHLKYLPCGREPVLHVGSRRGVPYRAKIAYRLVGKPAPLPTFFSAEVVDRRLAARERVDFEADLWPLMAKEICWGYYHELFTAHPTRVSRPWADFAEEYALLPWAEIPDLVADAVPEPADRFDVPTLDHPLRGAVFPDLASLQPHLRAHIAADLRRRGEFQHSADLGATRAILSVNRELRASRAAGRIPAPSMARDVHGWWQGFLEYYTSGPPAQRNRQLLALAEAGIVRFLGAGMWVEPDEERRVFLAGGSNAPDAVEATALVEARLPQGRSTDPLLRGIADRGESCEDIQRGAGLIRVRDSDFRVLDCGGQAHPRRFAIGPFTTVRHFATFATPRTNAVSFRQNDTLARTALRVLASATDTEDLVS